MLHTITSLDKLSGQAVIDMAKAAADRGELLDAANVFEPGTDQHRNFRSAFLKREAALEPAG